MTIANTQPSSVVAFPKPHRSIPPQTMKELNDNVTKVRQSQVNMTVDEMSTLIPMMIYDISGFTIMNDDCIKDYTLVVESIRSLLFKVNGIDHPLQTTADKIFAYSDTSIEKPETPTEE